MIFRFWCYRGSSRKCVYIQVSFFELRVHFMRASFFPTPSRPSFTPPPSQLQYFPTNQPRSPESKRPHPRETSLPSSAASHSLVIRWRPPPTITKNGVHNSQKNSSTNISRTGSFHSLVPQCGFVCASRDSHPLPPLHRSSCPDS